MRLRPLGLLFPLTCLGLVACSGTADKPKSGHAASLSTGGDASVASEDADPANGATSTGDATSANETSPASDTGMASEDAPAGLGADSAASSDTTSTPDSGALPPGPKGMATIPAGAFQMGCAPGDASCTSDEKPAHAVTVDAFYLDTYEVTTERYEACVAAGSCTVAYNMAGNCTGGKGMAGYPINCVNFTQAQKFCQWAGGRLPTEAEWEFAARGGLVGKKFVWGDQAPTCEPGQPNAAFWSQCTGVTVAKVGATGPANGYGLYDMAGNMVEMVADWYAEGYYATAPAGNPSGPASGTYRVTRDLALAAKSPDDVRVSRRGQMGVADDDRYFGTGFRCAKSAK